MWPAACMTSAPAVREAGLGLCPREGQTRAQGHNRLCVRVGVLCERREHRRPGVKRDPPPPGAPGSPLLLLGKELAPCTTCRGFLREGGSHPASPSPCPSGLLLEGGFALVSVLREHLVAPAGSGQRSPACRLCWGPSEKRGNLRHPGGPVVISLGRGSLGTCLQSTGSLIRKLG